MKKLQDTDARCERIGGLTTHQPPAAPRSPAISHSPTASDFDVEAGAGSVRDSCGCLGESGDAWLVRAYLPALELLARYDEGIVEEPRCVRACWELSYEDARAFVEGLPFYRASDFFGRERDGSFKGIVRGLYQSFAGQELYPSVQSKAANLLYQVVKDHPFFDGNKRCAAALLVYFLYKNGLIGPDCLRVGPNALTAITLMVALSAPTEKDAMVSLVENLL